MSDISAGIAGIHQPRGLAPDAFRLDGRVAVVSGGSKNIGLEIAAALLQAGAAVVITGRKEEQLAAARAGLRDLVPAGEVTTVVGDVSANDGPERIADTVLQEFETVDVLVNNAHLTGATRDLHTFDIPRGIFREVFDTNLFGPLELTGRLLRPSIAAGRPASVINVLSGAAFRTTPGLPAYSSSKAALWMLTRHLAEECGPLIRVNAVCPGIVTEDGQPRFAYGRALVESGGIPMGRIGSPEEVSAAVLYLASDAASYTTGAVIHCNGGRPW
ncbi:SDR family oxidoreductase [Microbacterium sp. zg-Y818]|uniref:SDR family NAD(P)-dependent oxidoreductase n=1 Tax=unclassified Microbacterium TaxID=2609290 RepID=UPI00214AEDB7|nr:MULTISPECIES: SDR family oxidoreductase [unclassified Microbacterium]MCR2799322.1 SDR family oxidoreductase [Microbacterium sp. zg.Y818]WIM21323.1 SDR family oxidoreductase [Microbacterium sp. zg-Y818]